MNTIPLTSVNRPLADYVAGLEEELFVLDGQARPVAALVPLSKEDAERAKLSADPAFREIIRKSREQIAAGKTVTFEDMKQRVSG
jgi:hypothetical protein